ncbi:MAG TPA: thioredoxin family protein [Longimicrobium sp.]|nr:thioredoxin family protein [Longimicrobium sp.]
MTMGDEGMSEPNHEVLWNAAFSWDDYLAHEIREHKDLWQAVWARSVVPAWATEEASALPDRKLMVISEDWCGDASNSVPVIARFAANAPSVQIRVVKRDENPELMDLYLTNGARSIPLVVVLDEEFRPIGRWGPRPTELQNLVLREKAAALRPMEDIYREVRRWYARDRGESILRELLGVMETGARPDNEV